MPGFVISGVRWPVYRIFNKLLEVRARVRLTLARKKQKVEILATIRRAAQTGMGLEFLDIDPVSNAILLSWIETLGKSG